MNNKKLFDAIFNHNESEMVITHNTKNIQYLPQEQKIQIINKYDNNLYNYIINLFKKFKNDSDNNIIKINNKNNLYDISYIDYNTNSLKSWINKNDNRGEIDKNYYHGRIDICSRYSDSIYITYNMDEKLKNKIIENLFNEIIYNLKIKEQNYFKNNDNKQILINKTKKLIEKYSWLKSENEGEDEEIISNIYNNKYDKISINELDLTYNSYLKIDDYFNKINKEFLKELKELNK